MNANREPLWMRMLDGAVTGIDVAGLAGEAMAFSGEVAGTFLSALLEIFSGL